MQPLFNVTVLGLKKLYNLPGSWNEQEYRELLQVLEVEDVDQLSGSDLLDFLFMALQDLEPEQAADTVLAHKLKKSITPGARQNIVQDFLEGQKPWEEVADITLHARIFCAAFLLHLAIPKLFPKPDLMQLRLQVQGLKPEAKPIFSAPPEAAFVTRVLADGMDENSILERLYDEQLVAKTFPEAEGIIWKSEFSDVTEAGQGSAILTVYSSAHWLVAMDTVTEFTSRAYNDREDNDEDDD